MNKFETLKGIMKETKKAWRALLNDPAVKADPNATHTPALYKAWSDAADRECAFREANELLDWPTRRRHH